MAVMAIAALLVAGLIAWALTRTVETPSTPAPSVSSTITPSSDTTGSVVPPIDTTVNVVPPIDTVVNSTAGSPITATTASQAPPPPMSQSDKAAVPRISAEDMRDKTRANAVTVIDVRDAASYASGHIPGSLHIPMASVESNLDRIPKGREIITYCT
jgi:hypothetical protein